MLPKIENDSSTLNAPSKPRLAAKILRSPPSAGDITFPSSPHSRYPINSLSVCRKNNPPTLQIIRRIETK
ncbi:hypothetical protein G6F56_012127 [Rhizopus delemar]|nr:hypothetical protein G6F56_012127 [Rhizopus delemar]